LEQMTPLTPSVLLIQPPEAGLLWMFLRVAYYGEAQ